MNEPDLPIVARVFTLRKLLSDNNLTDELTYEAVRKMNNPVMVLHESPSTYLMLLDLEVDNKLGNKAPVVCAVEHKKGRDGNRYLVSTYPLEDRKLGKITQQLDKLVYCRYNDTAIFAADAPNGKAFDLLRAAIDDGRTVNVADYADVVKWKKANNTNFSASMEEASLKALNVLRTRADERECERLVNDWQKQCELLGMMHDDKEPGSRLGKGAKMLGEIHALISATKGVLPEKYTHLGRLNGLLKWAAVYARMQQEGEVPVDGVIAGDIYAKFVRKMQAVE